MSLEHEAGRHRTLAIARDKLLQEIRGLPGFERFLLRAEFSQLRASAHSGPVVILNAAETRCDALIVLSEVDHVLHVPLPNVTLERSKGLQNMLKSLLGPARVISDDKRVGRRATRGCISWESVLSALWNDVVKPVLDALDFSVCDVRFPEFTAELTPFFRLRLRTDSRRFITHFLVSDWASCISSYPRGRSLRHPVSQTWGDAVRFRRLVVRPYSQHSCAPRPKTRFGIWRRSPPSDCPSTTLRRPIPTPGCGHRVEIHQGCGTELSISPNHPYGVFCWNGRGSTYLDEGCRVGPFCMPWSPRCLESH